MWLELPSEGPVHTMLPALNLRRDLARAPDFLFFSLFTVTALLCGALSPCSMTLRVNASTSPAEKVSRSSTNLMLTITSPWQESELRPVPRTSLFVSELESLYLAIPRRENPFANLPSAQGTAWKGGALAPP